MKIALDSWALSSRFRHQGIYVYTMQLYAEFQRLSATRGAEFVLFADTESKNDAAQFTASSHFRLHRTALLGKSNFWRGIGAGLSARSVGADLLFAPTASILTSAGVPLVCTIHDVTPVVMPSHSRKVTVLQTLFLKAAATLARGIITDSENSKQDLMRLYRLPESRIAVVYCGYKSSVYNDAPVDSEMLKDLRTRFGLDRAYILHHGTVQPRKNLERLIQAYRALIRSQSSVDLDLVLAGGLGWRYEEIVATARAEGVGRVVLTGALPDEELATLVKGAELVVIPSLYEGFCLPMIESMACAVPTIAATTSCLQEVSGGVLRYFDPCSIEEMKMRMQEVIECAELRKQLAVAGKAQSAKYSWERCGREALNAIESFQ